MCADHRAGSLAVGTVIAEQKLQSHRALTNDLLRRGVNLHALGRLCRARGEHTARLELLYGADHATCLVTLALGITHRRDLDAVAAGCLEDGLTLDDGNLLIINCNLHLYKVLRGIFLMASNSHSVIHNPHIVHLSVSIAWIS